MPVDLNALHASLSPTLVELCPEKPIAALTTERKMQVWKGALDNTWHFKTLLLGQVHEGTFDAVEDKVAIIKLNMAHTANQALRTVNITNKFNSAMHSLNRPYIKLSYAQQTELLGTYQGLDVFSVDINAETRKAACLAILKNQPAASSDSQVLKDLRESIALDKINVAGGNGERFLETRAGTTLAEMSQFIYFLLAAAAKDLGHAENTPIPAAPAGFDKVYEGLQPEANPDMLGALPEMLQNLFGGSGFNFQMGPEPGGAGGFLRIINEESIALDRFELALTKLKRGIPGERRETPEVQNAFNEMKAAASTWIHGARDIKSLLVFRKAGDKFIQSPIIQHHHKKSNFFGQFESEDLEFFRSELRELRDYSWKRKELKKTAEWRNMIDVYMIAVPFLSVLDCLNMSSVLPLCVLVGFTIPFYLNLQHGISLAGQLWEMPWEASQEYIEASRDLWSRVPLLLSGAAVGGAFLGLCAGLLVPGAEMALMVSTWFTISLVTSAIGLVLPIAAVLLGKGVASGCKAVYDAAFTEGEKQAEATASCSPA